MGNPKGFIEEGRKEGGYRPVEERINDYSEVEQVLNTEDRRLQASRCMDCGIPFCHWACPTKNKMPEWQDGMYKGDWQKASDNLHETNNFPEFTGRICPAPCEEACVLNIHNEPVTIRENECATAEKAFELGLIKPQKSLFRTGKKIAVIGSGPAGLACADLLNKWGHDVTLYEQDKKVGGLLRYGIPDFKLRKDVIDRRVNILKKEGLKIKTNTKVGVDITGAALLKENDAICLAIGAMEPRDLTVEGRDLKGIYFAMDFLKQQNETIAKETYTIPERIKASGKHVLVIGGGDTGSDCVGTSIRQRAKKITQIEILPKPPATRSLNNPWPYWPNTLRTSSSHKEGCDRKWAIATKRFISDGKGNVKGVEVVDVVWESDNGNWKMKEVAGSLRTIKADLVLLAMGFTQPMHAGLADSFKLSYDNRGNIQVDKHKTTSKARVFAAGDAITGASLVVRAIYSGREAAEAIHEYVTAK